MTKTKQVFISYATADKQFAHRLADDLRQLGVQVWIAPESIRPGEEWVDAIERGLAESSHVVIVLTPAALESRWVRKETNVAIAQERKGRIQVIPLDVGPCKAPLLLSSYQMVSFRHDYDTGFSQLAGILGVCVTLPKPVSPPRSGPPHGTTPEVVRPTMKRKRKEKLTGRGGSLFLDWRIIVLVTVLLSVIFLAILGKLMLRQVSLTSFFIAYSVRVQAKDTGESVEGATVTIESPGKARLDGMTDSNGLARISIYSSYTEQPVVLVVRATGYKTHRQHIDLTKDALPDTILLESEKVAFPTSTPRPTSISIAVDTPSPSYPAPTLLNPAPGATIVGETLTNFSWHWDGYLQEGERFDLRIWRSEGPCYTVAMLYEKSFPLDAPPDGFGHYQWQVAVVRIGESDKSVLSESPVWPFVWNAVPPTATPTATPTPIPVPNAVVHTDALNLRSGPGVVYDILGVLKNGDPLTVEGRNLEGDWLRVIAPEGQEGWVASSLLQVNIDMAGVPMAQAPPTPTPIVTPTPTLLPPPILLEPENGASFIGEPVILRWQWVSRPLEEGDVFSVRVRREGETKACHNAQTRDSEYWGYLTYCEGKLYWSVALARYLPPYSENAENLWQILSEPSEERWIYYTSREGP